MKKPIISIPLKPNFSFTECLWFLNRNFDDCLHRIYSDRIRKAFLIRGEMIIADIYQHTNQLQIEIISGDFTENNSDLLCEYVSEWFDLNRDISPFYQLLSKHQQLAYMQQEFNGLRLIGIPNLFEALCWGIIGQQINLTFAYKLKRRLVEKFGKVTTCNEEKYYIFPTCETLALAEVHELTAMQFSSKKAAYLIGVAQLFAQQQLSKEKLIALPDFIDRQKVLISVKGIGIWTANYALMKSLQEQSCIPYGDTGLMQSLFNHQVIETKKDTLPIDSFFQDFRGWESYLVFYLWRSLARK
jgi:DNA-3-methyladenine glycosylase II